MMRAAPGWAMLIGILCLSGCFWHRSANTLAPPPSIPAPDSDAAAASEPAPVSEPAPAPASPPPPASPPSPGSMGTRVPKPSTPAGTHATPLVPGSPATLPPAPAQNPPAPDVVPPARLGEILSPERRAELSRELAQNLAIARKVLTQVSNRNLSEDESEKAGMVRMFVQRAEAAKDTDLVVAAQLGRRAQLLAESLAASIR